MIVSIIVFIVLSLGAFWLINSLQLKATFSAKSAVMARGSTRLTLTNRVTKKFAAIIAQHITLDDYKRETLEQNLLLLQISQSPEEYTATRIGQAIIFSLCGFGLLPLIVFIPAAWPIVPIACIAIWAASYFFGGKKLNNKIADRKTKIEIELPNFANTIRQALNTTHDVMQIFKAYRKVCGAQLRDEIDKTLNDMYTGNTERALADFDRRINSAKLSELIRGLISVNRGDDQRVFFDILAHDYQLSAEDAITRSIAKSSDKLKPYSFLCVGCMLMMYVAGMGGAMYQQLSNLL